MEASRVASAKEHGEPKIISHPWKNYRNWHHTTIKDLKDVGGGGFLPNLPLMLVSGQCRRQTDHRQCQLTTELSRVVTQIEAAIPGVISLLEQINASPGTWYKAVDLEDAFFSAPVHKDHQKQFVFGWQGQQYTFTVLPQGYINNPALCHD